MRDKGEGPRALIVDDEPLNRDFVATVLAAAGWDVVTAGGGATALAELARPPALILMDLHLDGMSGVDIVAVIRAGDGPSASAPVLAYTTTRLTDPAALLARGFDGFVPKPCTPAELVAAARPWWPDGAATTLDRLEASLGVEPIRDMTDRFRVMLVDALARLDGDDVRALAHRVAGIAGTLGFAAAGQAWLRLSEGDDSARRAARLASRRAIAAVDRRADR